MDVSKPIGYDPLNPDRWNYTVFLYHLKLLDVTEPDEKVTVVLELMEYWYDLRLAWNRTAFPNVDSFYVRQSEVWSPSLSAFGVSEILDFRDQDFRIVAVSNIGRLYTYLSVKISATCPMDVSVFPFDTQTCLIRFCLPAFNNVEVKLINEVYEGILQENVIATMGNSEWKMISLRGMIDIMTYNDSFGSLEFSVFEIKMQRNPMYYVYMIIIPSFLINVISTIGVFMKSADRISRLNVGLTNIMTMTFILGVMAEKIPKTGNIPLLGIYILTNLAIMIVSITLTVMNDKFRVNGVNQNLKIKNRFSQQS